MKKTAKSLLFSATSLLLCVAMLLGSTYAWFTDSVNSGINQIIAGNTTLASSDLPCHVLVRKNVAFV